MMIYLKNMVGFKMDFLKGMTYNEIRPIFEKHYNSIQAFLKKGENEIEEEGTNDDDDVYTKATPLPSKVPIVDYQIHHENNKPYNKIIRADGTHKLFLSFITVLKNFDREDLETIWMLFKERFKSTEPKNFSNDFLLNTVKSIFEKPNVKANIWRDQKSIYRLSKQLGEGSAIPTNPQHTPTIIQPSSSQPQKIQKPRKPTRKGTRVPQPSGLTEFVADQNVHKELGDRLVPRNMRDTTSQTRFESVSKHSNDSLLTREKTKTTQLNEITSLKRRVKKLEKKNKSRTLTLKRLYKVGLTAKVESSGDEESLGGEEVFVVGQNENVVEEVVDVAQVSTVATTVTITIEEITLAQALEALKTSKPKVKGIVFQEPEWDDIQVKIDTDHQLAERLQEQEQEELSNVEKATLFQQLLEKRRKHIIAKRAEEKRNKPPTKAQERKIMCTYLKNMEEYKIKDLKLKEFDSIQKMFDRAFKRVNTFEDFRTELVKGKEKRAGEELIQEITKKQKVEDDNEKAGLK
nr:hypothetical protein [Tanacetum cinerariifolium]